MAAGTDIVSVQTPASWQAPIARCLDIARLPSVWLARIHHRAALAQLDTRQMRDCGIDPAAVQVEIAKPFWRA